MINAEIFSAFIFDKVYFNDSIEISCEEELSGLVTPMLSVLTRRWVIAQGENYAVALNSSSSL